ncbi:hypothetical protein D9758_001713 [Tetrapyrgos nigripes]|uniref:Uncharacterized protein n=1 Tax=Tetrapyrgos nigripes TaxID=182062 RepID=A0A8H5GX76_9AGAR|nr:hypothetical protein D9758_001713 [Tetrapyrgos nigripes]
MQFPTIFTASSWPWLLGVVLFAVLGYKKVLSLLGLGTRSRKQLPNYYEMTGVPPPTPLPNFDIDKATARPYRPFRWAYHQTMCEFQFAPSPWVIELTCREALKKMEPDWWIELESTYRERIAQRIDLHKKYGKKIINTLPGSELACRELMEMVIQFICARYPNQFKFDEDTGVLYNRILDKEMNTNEVHPLEVLNGNVPEDFLITLPDEKTGVYKMVAGVSCSSLGWNVQTKIGKPLQEIHGPVPDYKEKMAFSMDRYFSKMACDKPIQRGSWGLEIGQPLWLQDDDPHFKLRETQKPDLKVEDIYLRVDWQTLRRLPRSRAIVFNFKALFTPMMEFRNEPYIPQLILKVMKEGKKGLLDYKGTWHVEHKAIPALEEWSREQVEKGWVPEDWEVCTLDEDPYYPGWQREAYPHT